MRHFILDSQVTSLVNALDWRKRNDKARLEDQRILHDRLNDLESNQSHLKELFSMSVLLSHSLPMYNILLVLLGARHRSLDTLQKIVEGRSGED